MKRVILACGAVCVLTASLAWAVSQQWIATGTVITWGDTGRTHPLTFNGIAAGTLRMGTQHDKGINSQIEDFTYFCQLSLTGTNVVKEAVEFYVAWSDGTIIDGNIATTDASAASPDKRFNLKLVGLLVVDQTTSNTVMRASGRFKVPSRFFSLGYYNGTQLPLQAVTTNYCAVYPTPPEMQ
jgi:hypothetical protein